MVKVISFRVFTTTEKLNLHSLKDTVISEKKYKLTEDICSVYNQ